METKLWAIGLIVIVTLFTSLAQILFKFGAEMLPIVLTNKFIWLGFLIYGLAALLMIIAFKGGEVSVLYPILATSYLWVTLLYMYIYDQPISLFRWFGVFLIIIGISYISLGSRKVPLEYTEAI